MLRDSHFLYLVWLAWCLAVARAQDCSGLSCVECLQDSTNCGAWQPVGRCATECVIADASCYTADTFPTLTIQETCQEAENQMADATLCASQTTCSECVNTTLMDGSTTCQWFTNGNYCASACGMDGCGSTTCSSDLCIGLSCQECLNGSGDSTSSCAWIPLAGCTSECTVIDTTCFLATDYNADQVCNDGGPETSGGAGLAASSWSGRLARIVVAAMATIAVIILL